MTSVYLSNLSPTTTKDSLDKFMVSLYLVTPTSPSQITDNDAFVPRVMQAFCGSIHNIEMLDSNKAVVTFEKPSAASTALMLNGESPISARAPCAGLNLRLRRVKCCAMQLLDIRRSHQLTDPFMLPGACSCSQAVHSMALPSMFHPKTFQKILPPSLATCTIMMTYPKRRSRGGSKDIVWTV